MNAQHATQILQKLDFYVSVILTTMLTLQRVVYVLNSLVWFANNVMILAIPVMDLIAITVQVVLDQSNNLFFE